MNRKALASLSLALLVAAATLAHAQSVGGAFSKDRLLKLLKLGDASQQELTQAVARKGVDFQPTADDEKELRQAGASDDLIAAVRANFRGAPNDAAGANNAGANDAQNDAQANPPANAQPAQNNAQQTQPASAAAAQGNQSQPPAAPAVAAPEVGFHGFQVGTYKGQAKDTTSARTYGTDTQKLEFKIDKIDAETGTVHASFSAEHYRYWDLNGTIDEDGALRLEGSPMSPGLQVIAHASGGVITAKYRDERHGIDGGEFTVKFVPDDFAAPPKRNN